MKSGKLLVGFSVSSVSAGIRGGAGVTGGAAGGGGGGGGGGSAADLSGGCGGKRVPRIATTGVDN